MACSASARASGSSGTATAPTSGCSGSAGSPASVSSARSRDGAAHHGGRGVVQLVQQTGRERAERGHPLVLAQQRPLAVQSPGGRHHQRAGRPGMGQQPVERPRRRCAARGCAPAPARSPTAAGRARRRAHRAGRRGPQTLSSTPDPPAGPADLQLPGEDDVHRVAAGPPRDEHLAGAEVGAPTGGGQLGDVLVRQLGEQQRPARARPPRRRVRRRRHRPASRSCANRTAIAPSPTAEAMRFIDPARTSPAANTPGTDVSSDRGGTSSGQSAGGDPEVVAGEHEATGVPPDDAVEPARPRRLPDEDEQRRPPGPPAPRCPARSRSPSSRRVPSAPATSVSVLDRDLLRRLDPVDEVAGHRGVEARRPGPAASPTRRTAARNTAAWPAELPPPTTKTCPPAWSTASAREAP